MADLNGSETARNLAAAFASEARAAARYHFFAQQADVEGQPDVAALFRAAAEGEMGHAIGHLDYLIDVGDPETGMTIESTADRLRAAARSEAEEAEALYPGLAETARAEGFSEIADWFDGLTTAEAAHGDRFRSALDGLDG